MIKKGMTVKYIGPVPGFSGLKDGKVISEEGNNVVDVFWPAQNDIIRHSKGYLLPVNENSQIESIWD